MKVEGPNRVVGVQDKDELVLGIISSKKNEHERDHRFLADTALLFANVTRVDEFYKTAVDRLLVILDHHSYAVISEWDQEKGQVFTRASGGSRELPVLLAGLLEASVVHSSEVAREIFPGLFQSVQLVEIPGHKDLQGIFIDREAGFFTCRLCVQGSTAGDLFFYAPRDIVVSAKETIEAYCTLLAHSMNGFRRERELERDRVNALESDARKSSFLANMSHEIRTPMNGIIGFSELILRKELPEERKRDFASIIQRNGKQLLALVNDIIDFSKLESGNLHIQEVKTVLNKQLDLVLAEAQLMLLHQGKTRLELVCSPGLPDLDSQVYLDDLRLQQVLNNLIVNAIKFTDEGSIRFGYRLAQERELEFFVEDTGIGLTNEEIKVLFQRFGKTNLTLARQLGGNGLGLSISKGLVNLLGGEMRVESEKNTGTRFVFTLPYKPLSDASIIPVSPIEEIGCFNWSNRVVLIVDDVVEVSGYLRELITPSGAKVLVASSGEQAARAVQQEQRVDIVLLNVMLKKQDGFELAKVLWKINPQLRMLAQLPYANPGNRERALASGFVDCIAKPIHPDQLCRVLNKYLM